jgi:hypothetical protein
MTKSAKDRDEYDKSLSDDLNELALRFLEKAEALRVGRGLRVSYRIANDQKHGHYLEVRRDMKNKSVLVYETHGVK